MELHDTQELFSAWQSLRGLLSAIQKLDESSNTFCLSHVLFAFVPLSSQYLLDLGLQGEPSIKYEVEVLGAASYALACEVIGWRSDFWVQRNILKLTLKWPIIEDKTDLRDISELYPCMLDLLRLYQKAYRMISSKSRRRNGVPYIVVKYSRSSKQSVATLPLSEKICVLSSDVNLSMSF